MDFELLTSFLATIISHSIALHANVSYIAEDIARSSSFMYLRLHWGTSPRGFHLIVPTVLSFATQVTNACYRGNLFKLVKPTVCLNVLRYVWSMLFITCTGYLMKQTEGKWYACNTYVLHVQVDKLKECGTLVLTCNTYCLLMCFEPLSV